MTPILKSLCAFGNKINVRTLFQHQSGHSNGVADVLHAADSAGPQGISIHHESIELHPAIARQKAAPACIKGLVVFHGDDGLEEVRRAGEAEDQLQVGARRTGAGAWTRRRIGATAALRGRG